MTSTQREAILKLLLDFTRAHQGYSADDYDSELLRDENFLKDAEETISHALKILDVVPQREYDRAYTNGHADGLEEACHMQPKESYDELQERAKQAFLERYGLPKDFDPHNTQMLALLTSAMNAIKDQKK